MIYKSDDLKQKYYTIDDEGNIELNVNKGTNFNAFCLHLYGDNGIFISFDDMLEFYKTLKKIFKDK